MGFLDKVTAFVKREAKDIGEVADEVKEKLDAELTKRETELAMTPSEKIEALQQQASDTDAKLDAIANKALGNSEPQSGSTRIVLPTADGETAAEVAEQLDDGTEAGEVLDRLDPPTADIAETPAEGGDPVADHDAGETEPGEVADLSSLPAPPAPVAEVDVEAAGAEPPEPSWAGESDAGEPAEVAESDTGDGTDAGAADGNVDGAGSHEQDSNVADAASSDIGEPAKADDADGVDEAVEPDDAVDNVDNVDDEHTQDETATDSEDQRIDEAASDAEKAAAEASAAVAAADFGKTPAQLKYERARDAANQLLEELRGELKADGEI